MGNRTYKKVTYSNPAAHNDIKNHETWYVRDASGNVMGHYEKLDKETLVDGLAFLQEGAQELKSQPIYGSTRIGQHMAKTEKYHRTLGNVHFELSNHLGNVLSVITDNKYHSNDDGTQAIAYKAHILSQQDYMPFGLTINSRKYNYSGTSAYRYGFNGKEDDPDWGGSLIQDYGFRLYSPAIGKFLSVDPISSSFPWYTPFQFAGNKPIANIDLDGLEDDYYLNQRVGEITGSGYITAADNTGIITQVAAEKQILLSQKYHDALLVNKLSKSKQGQIGLARSSIYHPNAFTDFERAAQLGVEIGDLFLTGRSLVKLGVELPQMIKQIRIVFPKGRLYSGFPVPEITLGGKNFNRVIFKGLVIEKAYLKVNKGGYIQGSIIIKEGFRGVGAGTFLWKKALELLRENNYIKGLKGTWLGSSDIKDNHTAFWKAINDGLSKEEAAFATPTGRTAKKLGFTKVDVIKPTKKGGDVKALFHEPEK